MTKQKHIPSSNIHNQSSNSNKKMSEREYHKKVDKIFKQQVDMLCAISKYTDAIGAIDAIKNNINNNTNNINTNKININLKSDKELLYFLIQYRIIKTRMYDLNTQIMEHNDKLLLTKYIKYNDNADNADNVDNADNADIIFDKLLNSINEFINDCNNLCKSSKIDLV